MTYDLTTLNSIAEQYQFEHEDLVRFDEDPYTRIPISRNENVEVMLICFREGQTSSVHHHQGSNCVVRVVRGKLLETLYEEDAPNELKHTEQRYLRTGDISGLDGKAVHQVTNLSLDGTVLLNFYSPPFKMAGFEEGHDCESHN